MFQQHKEFFSKPEHLGVITNTDGISLFKSSCVTLWPIYLQIANLPPLLRFSPSNIITCGVWFGQKKPDMASFLSPILHQLDRLSVVGFSFFCAEGNKTVRLKPLFSIFDLIAKAPILNMKQFNGEYGCPTCLHPGKRDCRTRIYLPPLYFHHFALLVCSMHILLQKKCSVAMCNAAQEMLQDFYMLLPELYDKSMCTINAHLLIHLPYFVKLWGPLWTHLAFSFESMSGTLTGMVHSTRKVAEQLLFCLDVRNTLQVIICELETKESPEVLTYLNHHQHRRSNMIKLKDGYIIGSINSYVLTAKEFQLVKNICRFAPRETKNFD